MLARSVAIFWIMEVDAKPVVALARKIAGKGVDIYDNDKERDSVHPAGVSGGGVFRVHDDQSDLWTPRKGLRLAGLQSSASDPKRWLRVKNANAIVAYFRQACPEIADALIDAVSGAPR